jgi:hypothetical protein
MQHPFLGNECTYVLESVHAWSVPECSTNVCTHVHAEQRAEKRPSQRGKTMNTWIKVF